MIFICGFFSQGCEIEVVVGTTIRDGNGIKRVINWCGCFVHEPHPAVRALGFLPEPNPVGFHDQVIPNGNILPF